MYTNGYCMEISSLQKRRRSFKDNVIPTKHSSKIKITKVRMYSIRVLNGDTDGNIFKTIKNSQ